MTLQGSLELVSPELIEGWAWDPETPDTPVSLVVSVDGAITARCLAGRFRKDLADGGIGDGRHAFQLRPVPPLSRLARHVVAVRREGDGVELSRSPQVLEAAAALDLDAQAAIQRVVTAAGDDDDLAARLAFVADLADQLRQIRSNRQSGAAARAALRFRHRGDDERAATEPTTRPRALVVDDRMPRSGHDAGSNAILSHMRALQRIGYDVTFAPSSLRGDAGVLVPLGIACCLHPWYASIEEVLRRQHGAFDLVYLHRVTTAGRYTLLVRDTQPKARLLYSVADLHHLRFARQAEVESRPELAGASAAMRLQELTSAWLADAVITHSTVEAALLRRQMHPAKVHVVPWSFAPRPTAVPFGERRGLAFIGGYGHSPNVDAALWLVDAILPEIEALGGSVPCLLAGSDMPEVLRGLRHPAVDPVGHVPDLAAVFDRVRLTVAPLAFGAGAKGKVLDSLAAGVPCVCTPAAAEGLDLPDPLLGLVAETPDGLARSILALHEDEALNRACGEAGLAYIAATANEPRVDALLRAAAGPAVR